MTKAAAYLFVAALLAIAAPVWAQGAKAAGQGGRLAAVFEQADANHDGQVTYEELKAVRPNLTQERFNMLDANHDGVLTKEDRAALRQEYLDKLKQADTNGDGKVSFEEAQKVFPKLTQERFNKLDRDHDGFLTAADRPKAAAQAAGQAAAVAPRAHAQKLLERLNEADANGDGKVTFAEAQKAFPNMTQERFNKLDRNGDGVLSAEDRLENAKTAAK
jgi:Ca2+-binding EF-hand superfamily protein